MLHNRLIYGGIDGDLDGDIDATNLPCNALWPHGQLHGNCAPSIGMVHLLRVKLSYDPDAIHGFEKAIEGNEFAVT